MSSVNKVIIVGNLGHDPEIRTFNTGGKVCNLRIATSESWRDRDSGEKKERTQWHSIAIMSEPLTKTAGQYLRKGSKVYIEGQLETRKWQDQQGNDRYSTEVVLRPYNSKLVMLDGRSSGGDDSGYSNSQGGYDQGEQGSGYGGVSGFDDGDSIPF